MHHKTMSINAAVMIVMTSFLLFGFLAAGVAKAAPVATQSGEWVKKDYEINGGWSISQKDGQNVITFDKKFKTKKGPDLKIFLSPKTMAMTTGSNATDGAVLVAKLKKNKGAQEYVLPDNIDLNDYKALLIHCEAYSVLWGGANL